MRTSKDSRIGSIYIASIPKTGYVKIGSAMNGKSGILRRLKNLSTSHVDDLRLIAHIDGVKSPLMMEHELHNALSLYQLKSSKGVKKEIFKISINPLMDKVHEFASKFGLVVTKDGEFGSRKRHIRNLSRGMKKTITHIKTGEILTFKTWTSMSKFLHISYQSAQEAFMEGRNLLGVWKPGTMINR